MIKGNRLRVMLLVFAVLSLTASSQADYYRVESDINEGWRFIRQDVSGAEEPSYDDLLWDEVNIPHTYNTDDVFKGPDMYRGIGWYRKKFTVDRRFSARKVFIKFEGVSLTAEVWVNGNRLGRHIGGYTGFEFDITRYVNFGAGNLLAVKVDNSNNRDLPPYNYTDFQPFPVSADYAIYGGIYRDVYIVKTGKAHIDNVFVFTPEVSESSAEVCINTEVRNYYSTDKKCTLITKIVDANGDIVKSMESVYNIKPDSVYRFEQKSDPIDSPNLWSPGNPYLYKVKSTIKLDGKVMDSIESPLGVRWFEWQEYDNLKLNGKEVFIRGINRHQDIKSYGYAVPNELHVRDFEMIKSAGFNLVRLAHYPQDPAVLNACDRLGLLVWEEIPVTNCISSTPAYLESAKSQMREMIRGHRNHPCVLVWSLGNESDQKLDDGSSEEYTNMFFKEVNKVAHEEDPTRKTISCNQHIESNQHIPDVYSPQYWMGWYGAFMEDYGPALDEKHRKDPYFITGEYGAASSIDRHIERPIPGDWTQEYQCLIHEAYVRQGEERSDWYIGHCLWVAFDFASPRLDRGTNAIPFMNQKGVWTFDRKPKDLYYFYRSYYKDGREDPMVYIVSHTWPDRWKKPARKNVWVYSNCDEVELFNGYGSVSLGVRKRKPKQTRFEWKKAKVAYNVLYAEARNDGVVVAMDTIKLNNLLEPPGSGPVKTVELSCSVKSIPADNKSKSVITAVLKDERGLIIKDSKETVTFTMGGEGKLSGPNPAKLCKGTARITIIAPSASLNPRIKITGTSGNGVLGEVDIFIRHVQ